MRVEICLPTFTSKGHVLTQWGDYSTGATEAILYWFGTTCDDSTIEGILKDVFPAIFD